MSNCQCTTAYFLPDENQWEPGYTCEECQQGFVNHHLVDEDDINSRGVLAPDELPF